MGTEPSFGSYTIPEITLQSLHPEGLPFWPFMFVTVACGAISGFHATQSPMASKCIMFVVYLFVSRKVTGQKPIRQ